MIPMWYLVFVIITSFGLGMATMFVSQMLYVALRDRPSKPRYRRHS